MNKIGTNILDEKGIYLHRGSDYSIWSFPTRKEPDYTDWHEVTLRDADLISPPEYEPKRITMEFAILRPNADRLKLVRSLFEPRLVEFYLGQLGQVYQLAPLRFTGYNHIGGLVDNAPGCGILGVEFEQRSLPALYRGLAFPIEAETRKCYITLDGVDLSAYGIVVQKAYDTALLPYALKRPTEVVPSKSIAIECTMIATSTKGLKGNLSSLWKAIDKSGSRLLNVAGTANRVYYTHMDETSKLAPFQERSKCFIKFTIHFQTVHK